MYNEQKERGEKEKKEFGQGRLIFLSSIVFELKLVQFVKMLGWHNKWTEIKAEAISPNQCVDVLEVMEVH